MTASAISTLLTAREQALLIWTAILLAGLGWWARRNEEIRGSLRDLASAFLRFPQLWLLMAATGAYVGGVVFAAEQFGLWHRDSIKETTYWFFGTAVVLASTAVTARERGPFLAKVTRRAVRLTILVEFLVNFYVFPLWAELFLLPVITFFVVMNAFSETDSQYETVRRFTDRMLMIVGFTLLGIATTRALADLNGLFAQSNAEALLVPPALTVALIPFLAAVAFLSAYEQRIVRQRLGFPT